MTVQREAHLVTVTWTHGTATFDERRGGTLRSLQSANGEELLRSDSLALTAHRERGGLWRMGMEFPGGRWQQSASTRDQSASIDVTPSASGLRVTVRTTLERRPVRLTIDFANDRDGLVVQTMVAPRLWRTITLDLHATPTFQGVRMHQPGGVVDRPLERRYSPTFWPLHSWAEMTAPDHDVTPVIATAVPTGLHATAEGVVEIIVARNAPRELAYGIVPLLGPAAGYERGAHRGDLAIGWTAPATDAGHTVARDLSALVDRAAGRVPCEWIVDVDDPLVEVISVKAAQRGDGIVVRLRSWAAPKADHEVRLAMSAASKAEIGGAMWCDSSERDEATLEVTDGAISLSVCHHLSSVRLITQPTTT